MGLFVILSSLMLPAIVMNFEPPTQSEIDVANSRCYDIRGSIWDRFPFPDAIPSFMKKFYHPRLGSRVLDIGSGTGVLASWLLNQGFDVLCIDPSTEMVHKCTQKGLRAIQCNVQGFYSDETFGTIFAILSLIHVPKKDFDGQLEKIYNMLIPDGLFFLAMLEGTTEKWIDSESGFPRYVSFYTKDELLNHTQKLFSLKDCYSFHNYGTGYMLFVFTKSVKPTL